jgi:hypothetical protein
LRFGRRGELAAAKYSDSRLQALPPPSPILSRGKPVGIDWFAESGGLVDPPSFLEVCSRLQQRTLSRDFTAFHAPQQTDTDMGEGCLQWRTDLVSMRDYGKSGEKLLAEILRMH